MEIFVQIQEEIELDNFIFILEKKKVINIFYEWIPLKMKENK